MEDLIRRNGAAQAAKMAFQQVQVSVKFLCERKPLHGPRRVRSTSGA